MFSFSLVALHEIVEGIDHAELEWRLLMFSNGIMIIHLRAVPDRPGCMPNTVGQDIANALTADNPVQHPVKSFGVINRTGRIFVRSFKIQKKRGRYWLVSRDICR